MITFRSRLSLTVAYVALADESPQEVGAVVTVGWLVERLLSERVAAVHRCRRRSHSVWWFRVAAIARGRRGRRQRRRRCCCWVLSLSKTHALVGWVAAAEAAVLAAASFIVLVVEVGGDRGQAFPTPPASPPLSLATAVLMCDLLSATTTVHSIFVQRETMSGDDPVWLSIYLVGTTATLL